MGELDHLSYSSISSYLLCGEAWRRQYVVKEPAPVSDSLVLGSAFHGAVEAYLKGAPDLEAAFGQSWAQQLERDQEICWENGLPDETLATGYRMVKAKPIHKMLDDIKANFDPEHGLIERRVELHVPGVPVPIIGYIDVITRDGVPGDFKTASRMWADGKADEEMQPLFYLAALNQEGILVPDWTFRHYVVSKGQHPDAKVFEVKRKPSEVFGLFEIIKAAWQGIKAGVYLMNPDTWKCSPKWCERWSVCRGLYA
jgi:hypothetical protein